MNQNQLSIPNDWYDGRIPDNVVVGADVYIDSSYAFAAFESEQSPGLILGDASGVYDRAAFVVGPRGFIEVGPFTCLNGTYLICAESIAIGAHCLLSWGVTITDAWPDRNTTIQQRRDLLRSVAATTNRSYPLLPPARPVVLEDNVWIGFDAVILPGVRVGRGSVIGCKTVIGSDVPPYHVVAGSPPRTIATLTPDDTPEVRENAMRELTRDIGE